MLVLGLGNPGPEYLHTRHNAGFDAADKTAAFFHKELKKRCFFKYRYASVPGGIIVEPLTYMNRSGDVVKYLKRKIDNPSQLAVVCDNMDLGVGGLRIKLGGGSCGQKGLDSIAKALGTNDFIRIYVGTGRPREGVKVVDYVLGRETEPEKVKAYSDALEAASRAIIRFLDGASIEELQREFNRKGIF